MDLQWEDRFRHVLNHMSAHGQRVGADVLVLEEAVLFMTETSYCFAASGCGAGSSKEPQVTVYFFRGLREVKFVHGTEDDFLFYCNANGYDLPDQLV